MPAADWIHGADHMLTRHGITPLIANEALENPNNVTFIPSPTSKSGLSNRTIGWSNSLDCEITVITIPKLPDEQTPSTPDLWGATAWKSNSIDQNIYRSTNDTRHR